MVAIAQFLGKGLYTPSEVAFYVGLQPRMVNRWVLAKGGEAAFDRQFGDEDRFISFYDFVQTLAIAELRRRHGLSLAKIRKAIDTATTRYGVTYPLARPYATRIFVPEDSGAGGRSKEAELVLLRPDGAPILLSGKHAHNQLLEAIVEPYLHKLDFDKHGLAEAYRPFEWKGLEVRMDPERRFGEPLTPSGFTVFALDEAAKAEGSEKEAALAYGVDRKEVELAVRYLDQLRNGPPSDNEG